MLIVFTGGGTGGHVLPNIAVIDELLKKGGKDAGIEIAYIGGKDSLEEKIIRQRGIRFYGICTGKLRRYFDVRNFIDAFKVPVGFFETLLILRKLKPDLIFAKGGYISVPVVFAARELKIPVWLHESDLSPGLANKFCSHFAQKIWLSFDESKQYFENKKACSVGNPIRGKIFDGRKEEGYKFTGFSNKLPVVLIMGGSTGALALNKIVVEALPALLEKTQVVHITGAGKAIAYKGEKHKERYISFEFLDEELAHIYSIADVIVSRAGSGSIFEALALAKPLMLVPLPVFASRGDQVENAAIFEKHGWALTMDQEKISAKEFAAKIINLLKDEKARAAMLSAQKKAKYADAAEKIAAEICKLAVK